jgi:hypothetical protein
LINKLEFTLNVNVKHTVTVDPRGSVMYVVQQKYSEQAWKDNVQTITTFSVPQSAQPGITHAIPRLEGSKLIAPGTPTSRHDTQHALGWLVLILIVGYLQFC